MNDPIEQAVRAGKIPASARASYAQHLKENPKATKRFLSRLAPVLATRAEGESETDTADDSYPTDWLNPNERGRAGHGPVPPRVGTDLGGGGSSSSDSPETIMFGHD